MAFGGYRPLKGTELFPSANTQHPVKLVVSGADPNTPHGYAAILYATKVAMPHYVRAAHNYSLSTVSYQKTKAQLTGGGSVQITFNGPMTQVRLDVISNGGFLLTNPRHPAVWTFNDLPYSESSGSVVPAKEGRLAIVSEPRAPGTPGVWKGVVTIPNGYKVGKSIGLDGGCISPNGMDAVSFGGYPYRNVYNKGKYITDHQKIGASVGVPDWQRFDIWSVMVIYGRVVFFCYGDRIAVVSVGITPAHGGLITHFNENNYSGGAYIPYHQDFGVSWPRAHTRSPDGTRMVCSTHAYTLDIKVSPSVSGAIPEVTVTREDQGPWGWAKEGSVRSGWIKTLDGYASGGVGYEYDGAVTSYSDAVSHQIRWLPEWILSDDSLGSEYEWIMMDIYASAYSAVASGTGLTGEVYDDPDPEIDPEIVPLSSEARTVVYTAEGWTHDRTEKLVFPDGVELVLYSSTRTVSPASYDGAGIGISDNFYIHQDQTGSISKWRPSPLVNYGDRTRYFYGTSAMPAKTDVVPYLNIQQYGSDTIDTLPHDETLDPYGDMMYQTYLPEKYACMQNLSGFATWIEGYQDPSHVEFWRRPGDNVSMKAIQQAAHGGGVDFSALTDGAWWGGEITPW